MKLLAILVMSLFLFCGCNPSINEKAEDMYNQSITSKDVVEDTYNQSITSKEAAELGILAIKNKYLQDNEDGTKKTVEEWTICGLVTDLETAQNYFRDKYLTGDYECGRYKDDLECLKLPSYIDGKPVTAIDRGYVPDQSRGYGDGFKGCKTLKELILPETIEEIGAGAFESGSIETIYIPSKVNNMDSMFQGCTNLKELVISENNEDYSFKDGILYNKDGTIIYGYVEGLEELRIGEKVEQIDFLVDSEEYTKIGEFAYSPYRNNNIKNITVDKNNKKYCDINGVLFNKDKTRLLYYPEKKGLANYNIPQGTKEIGSFAFWMVEDLKNVNIPSSVETIYENAFLQNKLLSGLHTTED